MSSQMDEQIVQDIKDRTMQIPEVRIRRDYSRLESLICEDDISSWSRLHICNSKLKNATELTTVMCYFAVLAAVEVNIRVGDATPELITAMVITTSLLVSTTMVLKVVCCSILSYTQSVIDISEIKDVSRSPHDSLVTIINVTWILASIVGPILFVLDLILLSWIKFCVLAVEASYAATAILGSLLIVMGILCLAVRNQLQNHSGKQGYRIFTNLPSNEDLTIISVDSSSSSSSYNSIKIPLINHSYLSSLYGATEQIDPMMLFSLKHENNYW